VQNNHHYTNSTEQTVKAVLSAGMDTDCGGFMSAKVMQPLMDKKQIDMALVDNALTNLFTTQMRLGFFDPVEANPYGSLGAEVVNTPAHQQLALEAAHQSIVLLKNEGGALPLSADAVKSVALSGRNAAATANMQGNYYGTAPFLVSPVQGVGAYVANATTADCTDECNKCSGSAIAAAASKASKADAAVVVVGLTSEAVHCADEAEGHDRASLLLPDGQADVAAAVAAAAAKAGKPAILVVMGGGPVDSTSARYSLLASAFSFFPLVLTHSLARSLALSLLSLSLSLLVATTQSRSSRTTRTSAPSCGAATRGSPAAPPSRTCSLARSTRARG